MMSNHQLPTTTLSGALTGTANLSTYQTNLNPSTTATLVQTTTPQPPSQPQHQSSTTTTTTQINSSLSPTKHVIQIGGPLNALSPSPDGSLIAVGGRTVYRIIKLSSQNQLSMHIPIRVGKKNMNYGVVDLKWHPLQVCANLIATAPTNGKVIVWNINNNSVRLDRQFEEHKRTVNSICWRPYDESNLLSGSQDGTVKLWDIRAPRAATNFSCNGEVRSVKFSPHYKNIFAAGMDSGDVQIWDIRKPDKFSRFFSGHNGLVLNLDWHPFKKSYLATGGRDRLIKIWDMNDLSRPCFKVQTIASVAQVLWRPQHKYQIVSCANMVDSAAHLWDLNSKYIPLLTFTGHQDVITGMVWNQESPDQLMTCSKDGNVMIQTVTDAKYPKSKLQTTALAWNVKNELAWVSEKIDRKEFDRFKEQQHQQALQNASNSPVFQQDTLSFQPVDFRISGNIKMFNNPESDLTSAQTLDNSSISYFAAHYKLFSGTIAEKSDHNARVAAAIGKHHLEKVWKFINIIYAEKEKTNEKIEVSDSSEEEGEEEDEITDEELFHQEDVIEDEELVDSESPSPSNDNRLDVYSFPGFLEQTPTDSFIIPAVQFSPPLPFDPAMNQMNNPSADSDSTGTSINKLDFGSFNSLPATPSSPTLGQSFEDKRNPPDSPSKRQKKDLFEKKLQNAPMFQFVTVSTKPPPPVLIPTPSADETDLDDPLANTTPNAAEPKRDGTKFHFDQVIQQILDYYSEQGDPQTCVAICAVLGNELPIEKQRVLEWYLGYIEILNRLKLFTFANEVINGSSEPYINVMNKQSTSVRTSCGKCGAVLQRGTICEQCKAKTNVCAICHLPVFGCFFWCQKCGHGGHMDHMISWFSKYGCCPVCCAKVDSVQKMN